jgi:Kef-type K+ transport system membrane component KefB
VCGPFALGLLGPGAARTLSNVSRVCLSFICITAGAEMRLEVLRPLFRSILVAILALAAVVFSATFFFTLAATDPGAALLPDALTRQPPACRAAIAALMASISYSFAPAATIAVVREARARGPFTSTMLGIIILSNVVVLLAFAVSRTVAEVACAEGGAALRGEELAFP